MNSMVEDIVGECFECQITTKEHRNEIIKPSEIPETSWDTVSIDFGGPFPDGHYNLVVIDKRPTYPEVEQVSSTSFKPASRKLRRIFSTYGIPRHVETDKGPPFNSKEFEEFAEELGFHHHKVTPEHPRANGEAESFMKLLNKTEQIAHTQNRNSIDAIQEMLMGYRSTPHPATGYSPYNALMKRDVRTKLDNVPLKPNIPLMERDIDESDRIYKGKWNNNRGQRTHNKLKIGDTVLLLQNKRNKWTTAYETEPYIVYRVDGSSIGARRNSNGREIYRDATHFKVARNIPIINRAEDWRENLLRRHRKSNTGSANQTGRRESSTWDRKIQSTIQ